MVGKKKWKWKTVGLVSLKYAEIFRLLRCVSVLLPKVAYVRLWCKICGLGKIHYTMEWAALLVLIIIENSFEASSLFSHVIDNFSASRFLVWFYGSSFSVHAVERISDIRKNYFFFAKKKLI